MLVENEKLDIPRRILFLNFLVGSWPKVLLLGPAIFKFLQPNWHYCTYILECTEKILCTFIYPVRYSMKDYFWYDHFRLAQRKYFFLFYCHIRNVKNVVVFYKNNCVRWCVGWGHPPEKVYKNIEFIAYLTASYF